MAYWKSAVQMSGLKPLMTKELESCYNIAKIANTVQNMDLIENLVFKRHVAL